MKWLVPPSTFAEGQRAIYGAAVILAGVFAGLVCLAFIAIFVGGVWLKVWPQGRYEQILTILGYGFAGFICAMVAVICFLAVGGPVGKVKGGASLKDGVNIDVSDHESASLPSVTTTTTVTPSPTVASEKQEPKLP
jgi:hypothetical protein